MTPTPTILEPSLPRFATGGPPPPARRGGAGGGGAGGGRPGGKPGTPGSVAVTGMWVALAPISMLFLAFVSAYVVRHGVGADWTPVDMPRLLWLNTLLLLASSAVFERGRRVQRHAGSARAWTLATLVLGVGFVVGQLFAWRELRAHGIFIDTNPFSSFFYLLTGTHAVHLAGGILALATAAVWPSQGWRGTSTGLLLRLVAIYWHFMGVLWLGLFALFNFWR